MSSIDTSNTGELKLDPIVLERSFNRDPFAFEHNLSTLDIFDLGSLRALAEKYIGHEHNYMVAASASTPDQKFRAVKTTNLSPSQAFDHLRTGSVRIFLKRPQEYDSRFSRLLNGLVEQVI